MEQRRCKKLGVTVHGKYISHIDYLTMTTVVQRPRDSVSSYDMKR